MRGPYTRKEHWKIPIEMGANGHVRRTLDGSWIQLVMDMGVNVHLRRTLDGSNHL